MEGGRKEMEEDGEEEGRTAVDCTTVLRSVLSKSTFRRRSSDEGVGSFEWGRDGSWEDGGRGGGKGGGREEECERGGRRPGGGGPMCQASGQYGAAPRALGATAHDSEISDSEDDAELQHLEEGEEGEEEGDTVSKMIRYFIIP